MENIVHRHRNARYRIHYHLILKSVYPLNELPFISQLTEWISESMEKNGCTLEQISVCKNWIHIRFEADPSLTPGKFVAALKTRLSRLAGKQESFVKKDATFWMPEYFLETIGEEIEDFSDAFVKEC